MVIYKYICETLDVLLMDSGLKEPVNNSWIITPPETNDYAYVVSEKSTYIFQNENWQLATDILDDPFSIEYMDKLFKKNSYDR